MVTLLVSELVTDAALVGAAASLALECHTTEIRITVTQPGPASSMTAPSHRRLTMLLVDKLSREWGVEAGTQSSRHWCRVPTSGIDPGTSGAAQPGRRGAAGSSRSGIRAVSLPG